MGLLATGLIFGIVLLLWKIIDLRLKWYKIGVPQLSFREDLRGMFKRIPMPELVNQWYTRFSKYRYGGVYMFYRPTLLITDVNLIRQLAIKDFDHFTDHLSIVIDEEHEPLWPKNLFVLQGKKWRHMRTTLSPAFTSSKMKSMFNLMVDCSKRFTQYFEHNISETETIEVDLKDIFSRYTNDVIATCAFGVECNSMVEKENDFFRMGKDATNFSGFWRVLKLTVLFTLPNVCKHIGIQFLSTKINQFFIKLVEDTVKYREDNNVIRPDMIHLLMEARKGQLKYEESDRNIKETGFATVEESTIGSTNISQDKEISTLDMTAQVLIFFFAGFDTTSTVMSFMGYELSVHPDIQQRLYEEVEETYQKCNGKVNYEALNKMVYFDMVVSEVLRKWPPVIAVDRICTTPYTIQPENEGEVPITLKKGDPIWFPAYGLHHDPKYYPNPEKFDPERFSEENKHNINPYTYMPFGVGPRNCIGSRFALLELKALFFHLLHQYEIVVTEKTPIPLTLKKDSFVLIPERNFILGLKKR